MRTVDVRVLNSRIRVICVRTLKLRRSFWRDLSTAPPGFMKFSSSLSACAQITMHENTRLLSHAALQSHVEETPR